MGLNDMAWGIGFKRLIGDESLGATYGIVVDETNKQIHVCTIADAGTDWARSASSHPELCIHSATTPATEYIKLYDDATNAYIDGVGATSMQLMIAGTAVITATASAITLAQATTISTGGLAITAGGLLVTAGRIREILTPTDVNAQTNTLTVAQIVAGIIVHTSVTGAGNVTTDTALHIVAGSSGVGALTVNGQCIMCYYINDGSETLTLVGGTDVTIADNGQTIATNESALLIFRRVSATTVTVYHLGA